MNNIYAHVTDSTSYDRTELVYTADPDQVLADLSRYGIEGHVHIHGYASDIEEDCTPDMIEAWGTYDEREWRLEIIAE